MSEKNFTTISPGFDKSVKIDFTGETVTSNAGVMMLAELENRLGVIGDVASRLSDPRNPDFTAHSMRGLLSQRLFCIAAGYEDGDDADDLRHDPAMRSATGRKKEGEVLASQPGISRLERNLLLVGGNLDVVKASNLDVAIMYYKMKGAKHIWLDIDSYESPVHGGQEGSAYNGYYASGCYHPLVLHDGFGFKLKVELRPGNEYTSAGAAAFLEPVFRRLKAEGFKIHLTADSGFAGPDIFELCESYRVIYHIRLKSNGVLQREAGHLLTRPPGRPPQGAARPIRGLPLQGRNLGPPAPRRRESDAQPRRAVRRNLFPRHQQPRAEQRSVQALRQAPRPRRAAQRRGQKHDVLNPPQLP